MTIRGQVLCLIGGQYGSEGKGVIAAHLAKDFGVHVRVGGPNAGHSFKYGGKLWKMRSLPCGWVNPSALLVIGPGAIFDPEVLRREIEQTRIPQSRVLVDERAFVLQPEHDQTPDPDQKYSLRRTIGATGEGVGPARLRRMRRGDSPAHFAREIDGRHWLSGDSVPIVDEWRDDGNNILLEGTQGALLSLTHGPWPYVTSADTGAAQLLADCGIAPGEGVETLMVIRTCPIRVGGNSGPLPLEVTWKEISLLAGRPVEEFTTVTGRLRRVGLFHAPDVKRAILLNDPVALALMFLDYVVPECVGIDRWDDLPRAATEYVSAKECELGKPIWYVGTGGPNFSVVEVPR